MTIVGLVIQQHDGTILFQNVREYLSLEKSYLAAKAFKNQISSYDDTFIKKGSISHLTGSVVVLNMYRVYYMILNELFILAISQANDNPYEGSIYLARSKRVLWSVSKEYIPTQINKKYTEIYFALERVLFGEDGVEVLSQKISEVSPHSISNSHNHHHTQSVSSSVTPSFITGGSSVTPTPITIFGRLIEPNNNNINSNNNSNSNNINNINNSNINHINSCSNNIYQTNVPLTLSSSSSSSSPVASSNNNNNINQISTSSSNSNLMNFSSNQEDNINNNYSNQFELLMRLETSKIPQKIFTQPNTLPKIDKHIYDPPQTIKWGNPSIQSSSASSTRVTNRIMFTLRHPNAGKEAKEKEKENEIKEQQEINNMNSSIGITSNNIGSAAAGSASNKSSPSTSPLSSSYNPSSPETSDTFSNSNNNHNSDNQSLKNDSSSSGDGGAPDIPKRKFSLSMGTFNNKQQQSSSSSSVNNTSPLSSSTNNANASGAPDSSSYASAPPPVPLSNSKTKMNFLNF